LVKVGRRDRHFVHQLPNIATDDAEGRLAAGRDLWVVHERGRVLFASWIVRARMEAISTRDIDFALPEHVVGLDDAIGAPAVLGRGIATAAWSQMADAIHDEGMTAIVSKVGETDLAGRRAMERAGFRAVASVELQRVGRHYWVDVRPYEPGGLAAHLAAQLPARGEISA
jgi:RimJ/RimL family protein N-acetyltransferase